MKKEYIQKLGNLVVVINGKQIESVESIKAKDFKNELGNSNNEIIELTIKTRMFKSEFEELINEEQYETPESFQNQTDEEILYDLKNGTSFGMK